MEVGAWAAAGNEDPAPRSPRTRKPPTQTRAVPPERQYRRVDSYLSATHREIVMNPGAAAHGRGSVTTVTYHRPIQAYVKAIADEGITIDAVEEWTSARVSQPGPRATEENRARREIPMFLALRAVKA